jgi:hypothetical protein
MTSSALKYSPRTASGKEDVSPLSTSQRRSEFTRRIFSHGWLWGAVLVCLLLQFAAVTVSLLQRDLRTVPPSTHGGAVIVGCALAPNAAVEVVKWIQRMVGRRQIAPTGRG